MQSLVLIGIHSPLSSSTHRCPSIPSIPDFLWPEGYPLDLTLFRVGLTFHLKIAEGLDQRSSSHLLIHCSDALKLL